MLQWAIHFSSCCSIVKRTEIDYEKLNKYLPVECMGNWVDAHAESNIFCAAAENPKCNAINGMEMYHYIKLLHLNTVRVGIENRDEGQYYMIGEIKEIRVNEDSIDLVISE